MVGEEGVEGSPVRYQRDDLGDMEHGADGASLCRLHTRESAEQQQQPLSWPGICWICQLLAGLGWALLGVAGLSQAWLFVLLLASSVGCWLLELTGAGELLGGGAGPELELAVGGT